MAQLLQWFSRERVRFALELTGVLLALFYVLGQLLSSRFYQQFNVSPADVGLTSTDLAAQAILSAGSVALLAGAIGVAARAVASIVPQRYKVVVDRQWTALMLVVIPQTLFLTWMLRTLAPEPLPEPFGTAMRPSSHPFEIAMASLADLPFFIAALLVAMPLVVFLFYQMRASSRESQLTSARLRISALEKRIERPSLNKRRRARLNRLLDNARRREKELAAAPADESLAEKSEYEFSWRWIVLALGVLASGGVMMLGAKWLIDRTDAAASTIKEGRPATPGAFVPFGPQPLKAKIELVSGPAADALNKKCIIRLGVAHDLVVVIDYEADQTWMIPSNQIMALHSPCR